MAINIEHETIINLTQATKILPLRRGKRIAISTLWRWRRKGLRGVRLEYVRIGRNIATSREALNRFFNALTEIDTLPEGDSQLASRRKPDPTPSARRRQLGEADRVLEEAGI